jgi:dTDP-4-amino-4,6-dideoxygalactose transaminase
MNGFAAEPAAIRAAELDATKRVLESQHYVLGAEVSAFEDSWADYCNIDHCVGVGNGLDAIEIILRASGIGPGDQVITTPMTAIATVLAILRSGATPVLADIDPDTALLSHASVERCINPRTKAIVLVHLYGQVRNMDQWVRLCDKHDLILIEDCAQSHGAMEKDVSCGSFGIAGAFSFYPTKNLGAIGDAGAIATNDLAIAKQARMLRNYGQINRYEHDMIGMNSRLDELQAALLSVRLEWLPEFTARRQQVAQMYFEGIKNSAVTLLDPPQSLESHVYHLFVITTEYRQELTDHLTAKGVQSLIHYPISADNQVALAGIATDPQGLTNAHRHAESCLSIPCHPQMTDAEVEVVIEAINSFNPGNKV